MEHNDNVVVLIERKFDSFEEFSHLAVSWDADFRQMDAERFKSTMFQAQIGDLLISSARLGCHVEQHGATPVGMRTFAIPDVGSPDLYWFGRTVGQNSLLSFPAHREIDVFSRPGFCGLTFSVPESSLLSLFESKGFHEPEKVLDHDEQVFLGRFILLNRLRYLLRLVVPEVAKVKKSNNVLATEIQDQILATFIQILEENNPESKQHRTHNPMLLEHIIDYIHTHPHADVPLRISDLCSIMNVSERTLENLFKQNLGMTPKAYLTGQRLYEVHRKLWLSHPVHTLVTDIANNWGFWHMGHFAADYRKMFGELPSSTLKRHY